MPRLHGHERARVGRHLAGDGVEHARAEPHVGVEEHEDLGRGALRGSRAERARVRLARPALREIGRGEHGRTARERHLCGGVGRVVVDDHERVGVAQLREHAVEQRRQGALLVASGDDDGDVGPLSRSASRHAPRSGEQEPAGSPAERVHHRRPRTGCQVGHQRDGHAAVCASGPTGRAVVRAVAMKSVDAPGCAVVAWWRRTTQVRHLAGGDPLMSGTTYAPQQAALAAAARPCAVACGSPWHDSTRMWNAAVGMPAVASLGFVQEITTKRPARHLGGQPT